MHLAFYRCCSQIAKCINYGSVATLNYRKDLAPATVFPSSNELDIPDLLLSHQADYLDYPVSCWGRLNNRGLRNAKTIHFYTDDKAFTILKTRPDLLWNLKVVTCVEPNFSLGNDTPRCWAIS